MNFIAFLLVVSGLFVSFHLLMGHFARRSRASRAARELIVRQYRATSEFISDPAAPVDLCEALVKFNHLSGRRDTAFRLLSRLADVLQSDREQRDHISAELDRLFQHRPDLIDLFSEAVNCGFQAIVLQWPRSAALLARPKKDMPTTAIYERNAVAVSARMMDSLPVGFVPA